LLTILSALDQLSPGPIVSWKSGGVTVTERALSALEYDAKEKSPRRKSDAPARKYRWFVMIVFSS